MSAKELLGAMFTVEELEAVKKLGPSARGFIFLATAKAYIIGIATAFGSLRAVADELEKLGGEEQANFLRKTFDRTEKAIMDSMEDEAPSVEQG